MPRRETESKVGCAIVFGGRSSCTEYVRNERSGVAAERADSSRSAIGKRARVETTGLECMPYPVSECAECSGSNIYPLSSASQRDVGVLVIYISHRKAIDT